MEDLKREEKLSPSDKLGEQTERRAAVRYTVTLEVELCNLSRVPLSGSVRCVIRDASSRGFYFVADQPFENEERLKFRIFAPSRIKEKTAVLLRGIARCVRVERIPGDDSAKFGIGARVEKVSRRSSQRKFLAVRQP